MAARETWRLERSKRLKTCQFPTIKHVTVRLRAASRDNNYTMVQITAHEMPELQANSGRPVEYRGKGVYTDGGCARLCSAVRSRDISLGPNGVRDKRLKDEILEETPDQTDAPSLLINSGCRYPLRIERELTVGAECGVSASWSRVNV